MPRVTQREIDGRMHYALTHPVFSLCIDAHPTRRVCDRLLHWIRSGRRDESGAQTKLTAVSVRGQWMVSLVDLHAFVTATGLR